MPGFFCEKTKKGHDFKDIGVFNRQHRFGLKDLEKGGTIDHRRGHFRLMFDFYR